MLNVCGQDKHFTEISIPLMPVLFLGVSVLLHLHDAIVRVAMLSAASVSFGRIELQILMRSRANQQY